MNRSYLIAGIILWAMLIISTLYFAQVQINIPEAVRTKQILSPHARDESPKSGSVKKETRHEHILIPMHPRCDEDCA